ncbi:MAG: LuxR C-terminal-related transcriptional regulator [Thermodesulfobacteriota bacterium]
MENDSKLIDVIILSSSSFIRQALTDIIKADDNIRTILEASNKLELLDHIYGFESAIVIIRDQENENVSSTETINLINQEGKNVKSLLLLDNYSKDKELAALEMGVHGYLPENRIKTDLIKALKSIDSGQLWVRREIMSEFVHQIFVKINRDDHLSSPLNYFNKREMQVLVLINKSLKNKEIAAKLHISESTVKHYVSRIFKKLQIKKRGDIKKFI